MATLPDRVLLTVTTQTEPAATCSTCSAVVPYTLVPEHAKWHLNIESLLHSIAPQIDVTQWMRNGHG